MHFLKQCSECQQLILLGWREKDGKRYCTAACQRSATHPGFCSACLASTTDEGEGAQSMHLMGTAFVGGWNRCKTCDSEEVLKVVVMIVPIIPVARFRVINFGRSDGRILSRLIEGPAMTGPLWSRLGAALVVAVALWGAFMFALFRDN